MATKNSKGALLSRGQKTSAHSSLRFHSKLFKIRLVDTHPTLFGDYSPSNQWELILKAMEKDVNKEQEFKFRHPQHKDKVYVRHYIGSPEYGFALLTLGQFRNPLDFVFVRIVPKSLNYGEPYLVFVKFAQSFRNPHILAEMVERAFNWVLDGSGVKLVLEPWETDEKIMWYKDYSESFMAEVIRCKGEGLTMVGYEDALEYHREKEAKKAKRHSKKKTIKSDRVENYISKKVSHPEDLLAWLDENVKDKNSPIDMMRPVRLLINKKLMTGLSIAAFNARYHKEGMISVSSFNNYTNVQYVCFENDIIYEDMENNFDVKRYI